MDFLENNCDFMDLEEDNEDGFICTCDECGGQFILKANEDIDSCPICECVFD